MKKQYIRPYARAVTIAAREMLALSGNFTEGSTIDTGLHDDPINGDDAWTRGRSDEGWDDFEW